MTWGWAFKHPLYVLPHMLQCKPGRSIKLKKFNFSASQTPVPAAVIPSLILTRASSMTHGRLSGTHLTPSNSGTVNVRIPLALIPETSEIRIIRIWYTNGGQFSRLDRPLEFWSGIHRQIEFQTHSVLIFKILL